MGNCFTCFNAGNSNNESLNTRPISNKICQDNCFESDELLQTTNLDQKVTHHDSNHLHQTSLVKNLSKNCNFIDGKSTQSVKETQLADNAINKFFEEYKDKDEDAILSDGIERLCHDLQYSPDDFPILVFAFCLDAKQMCRFSKQEFIHGLKNLNAMNINEVRGRIVQIVEKLETDMDLFKQLYRFTFHFGLDDGARILNLDMAISLWKLVYTVHTPENNLLERWINFLSKENIRGIQRDTWLMFQNFAECFDINSYDSDEAWPSLFDDFVEYEILRLKQLDEHSNMNQDEQEKDKKTS